MIACDFFVIGRINTSHVASCSKNGYVVTLLRICIRRTHFWNRKPRGEALYSISCGPERHVIQAKDLVTLSLYLDISDRLRISGFQNVKVELKVVRTLIYFDSSHPFWVLLDPYVHDVFPIHCIKEVV
jgi:hypothetical protein